MHNFLFLPTDMHDDSILNEFLSPYLNDEIVAREYADICQSAVYLYFKKRYQEAAANDA